MLKKEVLGGGKEEGGGDYNKILEEEKICLPWETEM